MSTDDLHELKKYSDLPGQGVSEKLETAAKSITPTLGLEGASNTSQRLARNFATLVEHYKFATVLRGKDVPWNIGLHRHMFFFDDSIVNAIIIIGCGIAIVQNFDLLLPLAGIGAFYVASDRFVKTIDKLG